jgi:hypothetical protein
MIDMKMKRKSEEAKTMLSDEEYEDDDETPKYPYGLELTLDSESLEKLGIGVSNLPKVGQQMQLAANVEVKSVGMNEYQGESKPNLHVCLQITAMELSGGAAPDQAEVLFGGK